MILLRETKVKVYFFIIIIRFYLSTVSLHAIDLISNATAIILSIKTKYLAHYIFRTILVVIRFIRAGKHEQSTRKRVFFTVMTKGRAAFIVRLVMFKSKEKYNDKKRLQDIVLLTAIHVSGCTIDIANGLSSYKSRFSHARALFF